MKGIFEILISIKMNNCERLGSVNWNITPIEVIHIQYDETD